MLLVVSLNMFSTVLGLFAFIRCLHMLKTMHDMCVGAQREHKGQTNKSMTSCLEVHGVRMGVCEDIWVHTGEYGTCMSASGYS